MFSKSVAYFSVSTVPSHEGSGVRVYGWNVFLFMVLGKEWGNELEGPSPETIQELTSSIKYPVLGLAVVILDKPVAAEDTARSCRMQA